MKMALSEFALREKGIYGVLHIVILLLSLFLVVSISVVHSRVFLSILRRYL